MKTITLLATAFALLSGGACAQSSQASPAARLADMINTYRGELGLPAVPLSQALTKVAEAHAQDLEKSVRGQQCNMHSWSSAGEWTPCCYTNDHARAQCMWAKPRELTRGTYAGNGYEIAHGGGGRVTPEGALRGWRGSQGHHEVIINKGIWSTSKWQAMGVAITEHYALVWFGEVADPSNRP